VLESIMVTTNRGMEKPASSASPRRRLIGSGLIVGAVAYLFDPDRGRRRRAQLVNQLTHLARVLPDAGAVTMRDALNRSRGLAAAIGRLWQRSPVDDSILAERVRSALGRAARHSGAVTVDAAEGTVTLSGPALANEAPRLLAAARRVPGVRHVEDRLAVREEPGHIPALQSPGPQPQPGADLLQEVWAPTTRFLAMAAGTGTIVVGLLRGGFVGFVAAAGGALVALRGLTNIGVGRLLGLSGGRRGIDVRKTIEVDAPVEAAYTLWSHFEEFPTFMSHVREVRRTGNEASHWVIGGPLGAPIDFDATVTKWVPNEVIAWKSVDGEPIRHSGIVRFERRPASRSRITVRMTYNPPGGLLGHAVAALFGADPKRALDDDLVRFQSLLVRGKTTSDGREVTIGEVDPDAAAWSPVAAGAGMSPAGVTSEAVAEQRPGHEASPPRGSPRGGL
jgi:uncharacterized membrane protein